MTSCPPVSNGRAEPSYLGWSQLWLAKQLHPVLYAKLVLVNTSGGPIVDEGALIDALRDHTMAGAALDVFDIAPLPAGRGRTGCRDR
jgi:D-isomer specific 2-hydroxyacid dehydrogenase, NAD binding domain